MDTSVSNNNLINSIGFIKEATTKIIYNYSTKWFQKLKHKQDMEDKKQVTAVAWLVQEINKINVSPAARRFISKLEKQAKEIEKREHETTFHRGINIGALNPDLDIENRKQAAKNYVKGKFENK
jgi:hypothetical protein